MTEAVGLKSKISHSHHVDTKQAIPQQMETRMLIEGFLFALFVEMAQKEKVEGVAAKSKRPLVKVGC